jgi:hypothetical protein
VDLGALRAAGGSAGAGAEPEDLHADTPTRDDEAPARMNDANVDAAVASARGDGAYVKPECRLTACEGGDAMSREESIGWPEGTCVRVAARGQGSIEGLSLVPNGDLFAVTAEGDVKRYRDVDCDGRFDAATLPEEEVIWAQTGGGARNAVLDAAHGFLYVGAPGGVVRFSYCEDASGGASKTSIVTGMPEGERSTVLIVNGALYVSGSELDMPVVKRFALERFAGTALAWNDGEIVTRGTQDTDAFVQLTASVCADDGSWFSARDGVLYHVAHAP